MIYSAEELAALIPIPSADAHKYSRGKLVVVAGAAPYGGAACLCAKAGQFSGAGYTQVFTAPENALLVRLWRPSLVVEPFERLELTKAFSGSYPGACVVGSGFDVADKSLAPLVRSCIEGCEKPLLIDGGALAFCAKRKMRQALISRAEQGGATLLTPHEGEALRLAKPLGLSLGKTTSTTQDQRAAFAHELACAYRSFVVLKGSDTIIAPPDARGVVVMDQGTAVLAKAGTGDVLAGVIGGLLAQGLAPVEAAYLGATLHARAGLYAAERTGVVSTCAEEVLEALPEAIRRTQNPVRH